MMQVRKGEVSGMHIVLYQPEIPANTGNIGRTCVATNTVLHLIEPLGFRLTGRELRRAGMDYWDKLDVTTYINYEDFLEQNSGIMFGKESAGIPEELLVDYQDTCIRIPMLDKIRSLNLANSVSIVLYEALRQQNFAGMQVSGELHRLEWGEACAESPI